MEDGAQRPLVTIVEVSARDGLQNEAVEFSTGEKARLIEESVAAGLTRVESCSFVNPKRVPQMADAEAVMEGLSPTARAASIGLVLNERGIDRAIAAGLPEINYVVVATETFSRRNQGMSVDENLAQLSRVIPRAKEAGIRTSVGISAAFGCPYEGEVSEAVIAELAKRIAELQPEEIGLADTIGAGVPPMVADRVGLTKEVIAGSSIGLRCHFHNTRNTGVANAYAAVLEGVRALDASIGGIGGCPFAPRATGNVATEDLVFMLERSGYSTGVDLEALFAITDWLGEKLGKPVPGLLSRAGNFPPAA
ncbi:MAG: hydroxymethylglutaryl-CoA lyase [Nitrospiraceae bacterium]|nr:hydroxymethylglutaryl-CoA lyase [Nitrospiraceae bacterium]